ncbi:MAG: galactose-1-phosphate uridylyltransferase [Candidatus Omnitrophica bacterium]|nr:galactose-1-phosphate uridylyltransferase [Candidatus Omnitrophota bacterium]
MPQLRKDPVVGRWVIIAKTRARRPGNFVDRNDHEQEDADRECPFCNVQPGGGSPVFSSGDIHIVSSQIYSSDRRRKLRRTKKGLYDVIDGLGAHEIVIETPEHLTNMADLDVDQIQLVLEAYSARMQELEKNPQFRYVLAYKDYGPTAEGRRRAHTCSHIVATPVRPLRVKEKLTGAKEYFDANKTCVYCDLIAQELESRGRIIYETEHFLAVTPFAARSLFETWVLPKAHHCDFPQGIIGKEGDLAAMMKMLLKKFQQGLDDPAYNFVVQTAPFVRGSLGKRKWESIERDYHWHIELMPRLTRVAGFEKGTGFYICAIPPEDMAEYLREVEVT